MIGSSFIVIGVFGVACWILGWVFIVRPELRASGATPRTGANIPLTIWNDYLHLRELRKGEGRGNAVLDVLIGMDLLGALLILFGFVLMGGGF